MSCKNIDRFFHFEGWKGRDEFDSRYCPQVLFIEDFNSNNKDSQGYEDTIILESMIRNDYYIQVINNNTIQIRNIYNSNLGVLPGIQVEVGGDIDKFKKENPLSNDLIIRYR